MSRRFTHRLRVRYSECDQQNVVFNGHYLFFYDVALTELWREALGPWADLVDRGIDLVVAESRLRYLDGARFDEELDIDVPIATIGTTSLTTTPTFRVGDRHVAEGEVRHVFIDVATKAKTEIPADVREALSPYLSA